MSGVLILRHPTPLYGPETKGGRLRKGWVGEEHKKVTTLPAQALAFFISFFAVDSNFCWGHILSMNMDFNMGGYVPHVDQQAFDELECC